MHHINTFRPLVRRITLISLLCSMAVWMAGCASTSRMHHSEKHGQVPCPCEKNSRK